MASKQKLSILRLPHFETLKRWSNELEQLLINSDMFDVEFCDTIFGIEKEIDAFNSLSLIKIDDTVVLIDTWDTPRPLCHILQKDANNGPLSRINLFIKIQCGDDKKRKKWSSLIEGTELVPWTMFSQGDARSKHLDLKNHLWDVDDKFEYDFFSFGLPRHGKRAKTREIIDDNFKHYFFESINFENKEPEYLDNKILEYIFKTKWGLVSKGGGWNKKNRRESIYAKAGIPLVLDYKPYYLFDLMVPDKDYILLNAQEDVNKIDDSKLQYYSERSTHMYEKLYSAKGASDIMLKLIENYARK